MLKNFFLVLCFVALVCFAGCSSKNDESAIAEKGPAGSSGSVEAEGVSAARIDQLQKKIQHAKKVSEQAAYATFGCLKYFFT